MALTHQALRERTRCLKIDDIVYPPRRIETSEECAEIVDSLWESGILPDALPENLRESARRVIPEMVLGILDSQHRIHYEIHRSELPWVRRAPRAFRGALSRSIATNGAFGDEFAIVGNFPYTGADYVIVEGGLVERTCWTFRLGRLIHIRQLGFLHDPVYDNAGFSTVGFTFPHTRYCHVLDTTALMTLMCFRNGITGNRRACARIAGLCHDAMTPAGGDTIKMVDPAAFDEDANFPELLDAFDWSSLRRRYRLTPDRLIRTVQGKGVLGKLLDIADKLAYVSRDAHMYEQRFRKRLHTDPFVCSIWDCVRVENGNVLFTDAERLAAFLLLRVRLFRELYFHPKNRFLEFMLGAIVVKYLYERGRITRQWLLTATDFQLEQVIGETVGAHYPLDMLGARDDPAVESFATLEEAQQCEQELLRTGRTFVFVESTPQRIKACTDFLIRHDGRMALFHDQCPHEAAEIENAAEITRPYHVYSYERNPPFSQEFLADLRSHRLNGGGPPLPPLPPVASAILPNVIKAEHL